MPFLQNMTSIWVSATLRDVGVDVVLVVIVGCGLTSGSGWREDPIQSYFLGVLVLKWYLGSYEIISWTEITYHLICILGNLLPNSFENLDCNSPSKSHALNLSLPLLLSTGLAVKSNRRLRLSARGEEVCLLRWSAWDPVFIDLEFACCRLRL